LERQKTNIENEIFKAEKGEITILDETQIKERFMQAMSIARDILTDFRAVENNFRTLDRNLREKIATWDRGKGELLETIFNEQDDISLSEQGKSFSAFWKFLMSQASQEAFTESLDLAYKLKPVRELKYTNAGRKIHYDWIDAGSVVQETIATLSQQLRRYVDETFLSEERRINQILREIEGKAISIRNTPPRKWNLDIDNLTPEINMPMDRPMFIPPRKPIITSDIITAGDEKTPLDALYSQIYVDKDKLTGNIEYLLQFNEKIGLSRVIDLFPIEHGLHELLVYFVIASENKNTVFYGGEYEEVSWDDNNGIHKTAKIPRLLFSRQNTNERKNI
jgi:hypothetical protein